VELVPVIVTVYVLKAVVVVQQLVRPRIATVQRKRVRRRILLRSRGLRLRMPAKKTPRPVSSNGKTAAAVAGATSAGVKLTGVRSLASAAVLVIVKVVVAVPPAVSVGFVPKVQPASAGSPEQASAIWPAKPPTDVSVIW
jgi:hypothetical protein